MTADERIPEETPFAMVRRGFDPRQVTERLDECALEIETLGAGRDAAAEQATLLAGQLDAARVEIKRLQDELRALSGPPDGVESMCGRLGVLLHMAQDEFGQMRDAAQQEVAELCSLRERLAQDLDASRDLIAKALPDPVASVPRERDGHSPAPARTAGRVPAALEPVRVPTAEDAVSTSGSAGPGAR